MKKYKEFINESKKSNKPVLKVNRDIEIQLEDILENIDYAAQDEFFPSVKDYSYLDIINFYKTNEPFRKKVDKFILENLEEHLKNIHEVVELKEYEISELLEDENLKEYIKKKKNLKDLNI